MPPVAVAGEGDLPSVYAVSDLAAGSIGAAGAAVAELLGSSEPVEVDRRLASLWFGSSFKLKEGELPGVWDAVAGDYAASDGWIRLHTNALHHRAAALAVLRVAEDRAMVAQAVRSWRADELEAAVVKAGGCAAKMYNAEEWCLHPQGSAIQDDPLVDWVQNTCDESTPWAPDEQRPLQGVRVLDLTRVIAGPVATRFLAGLGAEVLRIDPPTWDEPGVVPDMTLGKRCARLDLRAPTDRKILESLLRQADVLVHGYRADGLGHLGFSSEERRLLNPGLVDVCLNAYGWSGPWKNRRGFDSLVQMSCGIAAAGMAAYSTEKPKPLPVQALDHATGCVMAAAAIRGLTLRRQGLGGCEVRASLAATARLLMSAPTGDLDSNFPSAEEEDYSQELEIGGFGAGYRLRSPVRVGGVGLKWDLPACILGTSTPVWR